MFFLENPEVMCSRIFIMVFQYYGIGMELNMGYRTCSTFDFLVGVLLVLGSVVWTEILAVGLVCSNSAVRLLLECVFSLRVTESANALKLLLTLSLLSSCQVQ